MKKIIALFIVFALCLGGAYAGESDMQKCTDGIIGKELFDLDDEYPDRVEQAVSVPVRCPPCGFDGVFRSLFVFTYLQHYPLTELSLTQNCVLFHWLYHSHILRSTIR